MVDGVDDTLVVVGDSLLDIDLNGRSSRLCPDEPAPVVDDITEVTRPGGAGLAAILSARLRPTVLVTAIGEDEAGRRLLDLLEPHVTVINLGSAGTTVKTRVRVGPRTVVRLDRTYLGQSVPHVLDADGLQRCGGVLVSDYGLGLTGRDDVREAVGRAAFCVWDPHPRGARPVTGVAAVTPNLAEAAHFAGAGQVMQQSRTLLAAWEPHAVVITQGSKGALLTEAGATPMVLPAPAVHVTDPCGAGDAFAVHLTHALARGLTISEAAQHAVTGAAGFLRSGGVQALSDRPETASADPHDAIASVRAGGGRVVMAGGCFDLLHAGHVSYLQAARSLGDCLVVAVNSDASVHALKGAGRPVVPQEDRVRVLQALECVDAVIVFDDLTPAAVLDRVRPDVFAKGGDYQHKRVPEADVVQAYGGEVVVLPMLVGRSSSRLVHAARQAHIEEEPCRTRLA